MNPSTRFSTVRKVARVATTFLTRSIPNNGGRRPWVRFDGAAKAFRRAYVETTLNYTPARCIEHGGVAILEIDAKPVAFFAAGRLMSTMAIDLAPSCTHKLVDMAVTSWQRRLLSQVQTHGGISLDFDRLFTAQKARWAKPLVVGAIKQFLAHLDPATLTLARRCWVATDIEAMQWLLPGSDDLALKRQQALALYPALIIAVRPWHNPLGGVGHAIDAGRPLVEALASELKVRKSLVRRLAGATPQRAFGRLAHRDNGCFTTMDLLPAALIPQRRVDYAALRALHALLAIRPSYQQAPAFDARSLIARLPTDRPLHAHADLLADDGLNTLSDAITCLFRHCPDPRARLAEMGLTALSHLNRAWHREVLVASAAQSGATHWQAGYATLPLEESGLHLVELLSAEELAEEGHRQRHCVATYVDSCLRGLCRIVSVRDAQGNTVSTIQMGPDGQCIQHRGARNGAPPAAAVRLAKRLCAGLRGGAIEQRAWPVEATAPRRSSINMSAFWISQGFPVSADFLESRAPADGDWFDVAF